MKIGVIHYNCPGYSSTDFLKYASETGYGYVELSAGDVLGEDPEDIKNRQETQHLSPLVHYR